MADSSPPSFFEQAKRWWPVAALIAFGAALIWFSNIKQAVRDIAQDIDSQYHRRAADGALVQLARVPEQSARSTFRYMATFENRSDDPLLVTGVVYDIQEIMGAALSADANAVEHASADAESMKSAGTYNLRQPCKKGTDEPLVPPFRLKPHATGSIEVRIGKDITVENGWGCALEVRFKTNQGETNGVVPGLR